MPILISIARAILPVDLGRDCIIQIVVQIEGAEKSSRIEPLVGLNSLERIVIH
jgi:hypothetical protein